MYLREDAAGKAWLLGDGARCILEPVLKYNRERKRSFQSLVRPTSDW